MANAIYNSFKRDIINLASDTIKAMLVTSTYTPNIDTHTKRSDITNEVSGTGYTAGGFTLSGKSVTVDNATDKGIFTANNQTYASSTITARGLILYKSRGGASTADELIAFFDFGSDFTSTAGNFNINVNASGLINLT